MQSSFERQPVQGPRPLRACAEEVGVSRTQGFAACEYCNSQKSSTSISSSAHYRPCPCCLRCPPAIDMRSQKALKDTAERQTHSYAMVGCQQGTLYGYTPMQFPPGAATLRENSVVQQRNRPPYRLDLASTHVSDVALPVYAEAVESSSIDAADIADQRCRFPELRCSTGLGQFESAVVQEDYNTARYGINAAEVISASSQRFLLGEQKRLLPCEANTREPWIVPPRRTLHSQLDSHDKSPFSIQGSRMHTFSTVDYEQKCMTSSHCHPPERCIGSVHRYADLDVRRFDQVLGSPASYHCTQYDAAGGSPERLDSNIQLDNETGSRESTPHRPSPGVQLPSHVASASSATACFRRRGPSSASTISCASSQRQPLCCFAWGLPPPNASSFDLASFNARSHAPLSENSDCFAAMYPYSQTGKPPSPTSFDQLSTGGKRSRLSPPSPPAAEAAGGPAGSAATDLRGQVANKPASLNAPVNYCRRSEKNVGVAELSRTECGSRSEPVSNVSVASTVLAKENVPGSVVIESSASDIVVTCGLPPPESSAPVSLACRILIRRFAAAAATATDPATCHAPATMGGGGGGGEGKEASFSKTLDEGCSSGLRSQQFEDCGWAWQEDGGGFLLLRLQRKQLDKGKVKSASYEAFGREYGLFEGRTVNCAAPWKRLSPHAGTPVETEDFKSLIYDMGRQFPGAAPAICSSWYVLDSGSFSMETDSRCLPFGHFTQSSSIKSSLMRNASAESKVTEREGTALTASRPQALAFTRSLSSNTPTATGSCFLEHLVAGGNGSIGDLLYGECVKGIARGNVTGEGGTANSSAGRCLLRSAQRDVHGRLCQCCGDRRDELVGCTRSASLLETQAGGVCDGVAAGVRVAASQRSCQGECAEVFSSSESMLQLQLETVERNQQKHVMAAAATFQARKRHSSCEGRLEGWCAQQLSVRVIVRTNKPPAAASWNRQESMITDRGRLRKKVTFSVDCFTSDGETTSGVLCHLSPPTQQSPRRQPLISRVRSSTCRRPGGVLSRSRFSACRLIGGSACQAEGRGVTAAALAEKGAPTAAVTATAARGRARSGDRVGEKKSAEERGSVGDALRQRRARERLCVSSDVSLREPEHETGCASATPGGDKGALLREESFYILVDCRKPPRTSRWSRRGRTVVSRSYTRYLGPLLPLVIDLLEKERESVRTRCKDDRGQTEDKRGRAQQSRLGRPVRSAKYTLLPTQQQQARKQSKQPHLRQPQQQLSQQQFPQQHLQHEQHTRQQVGQQQRQPPHAQVQQRQKDLPQRGLRQQEDEDQQPRQWLRGGNEQRQPEGVVRTAASDSTRRNAVPGQSWTQARSEKGYSNAVGRQPDLFRSLQSGRTMPSSHVCPRYYHPLDTPETLFPQARARQLRRLLMLQNTSAFPSLDDPFPLPLLQGNHYGAASPSIERNLAAYHQLGRRSVAARAVATAARHPAMLSQRSNILQRQQSRRKDSSCSLHGGPGASSAAAHDRLRYATSGSVGSAGGFWRQPQPVGLRHAASCSFAFEHSRAGEGGLGSNYLRPSGTEGGRSLEEEDEEEVETEEDEDDGGRDEEEEKEEERRRRRPRFLRMRRNSGTTAAQDAAEDGRKLSRFSSLGSVLQQHGRSRISTGDKLKRLLMPLFFRSSSLPVANGEEEKDEKTLEREEPSASRKKPEQESEPLEDSPDDEDLWVTESDASTPPSSCVVVKKRTAQKVQLWSAPSASLGRKRHLLERARMRRTRQNSEIREKEDHVFSAYSAAVLQRRGDARLECVELKGKRNKGQVLLERDPRAIELPTVAEEPVEEVEAQRRFSEWAIRSLSEECKAEIAVKTDFKMAASEETEGKNNREWAVQQHQHEDWSSQLQRRQEQRLNQRLSRQLKNKEKQVEEQTGQPHPESHQEPRAIVQQQEDRGSSAAQPAPQQQLSATVERKNLPVERNFALQEETQLFRQDHQGTKQQQHPQQEQQQRPQQEQQQHPQQEQQQHPQPQESGAETQENEGQRKGGQKWRIPSQLQRERTPQSSGDQHVGTNAEKMKLHWFEGETGVRDELNLADMQQQRASVNNDEGESEEPENLAMQHCVNPLNQTQQSSAGDTDANHVQRGGVQTSCKQEKPGQLLVRESAAEQPESEENLCTREFPAAKDRQLQHTSTQQSSTEQKERSDVVGSLLPSSEQQNGSEHSRSRNQKDTFYGTNNETHYAESEEVEVFVHCKTSACERNLRVDDTVTAAKEQTQEKKLEEEFSGTRCNSQSTFPIVTSLTALSISANEETYSQKKNATRNMLSTSLVMRRALLLKPFRSAEAGAFREETSKRGAGDGVRSRWRGSTEWGTDDKPLGGVDYLPSPAAGEIRTERTTELIRPAAATTATVSARIVPNAAAGAAPALPLCSDEQIASSTAAGSQQTVNSPVNSWRMPLRKSSLATAFDQMSIPWSTRRSRDKKEDTQYYPTLLQRLSTRFRRRRKCGTHGSLDEGIVFETSDTT